MNRVDLIFGPPGTGKTTELLKIMEKELEKHRPDEIAFVSFTRKGAQEGKSRAVKKFGMTKDDLKYFRTLHSMAFNELQLSRYDIIGKPDYKEFSKALGMNFCGYYTEDFRHNDDAYLFFDILRRNNARVAMDFSTFLDSTKLRYVRENYNEYKKRTQLFDFTDIVEKFIEYNKKVPVKVAIVDEAQDLTTLQWKMVLCAFRDCERLYLAGDDDQAIYEWSGADLNFFLNFKGAHIKILKQSFRLPDNLVSYAKCISNDIQNRIDKNYIGTGREGNIEILNNLNQLQIDNMSDWLFLARNNSTLKGYEEYFREKGIVYNLKGELSVKESEIDAIRNFNNMKRAEFKNKPIPSSLRIHLKTRPNMNGEWFNAFNWPEKKIAYYKNIVKNDNLSIMSKLNVSTIHAVKGGEADNVVITEDVTNNVKKQMLKNPDSENRIFYTGVTRTKKNLYILQKTRRSHFNLMRYI